MEKNKYPILFSPLKVGKYLFENRVVTLPVHTGYAHTDGRASSWMIDFYSRLAGAGASMVVVANTAVSRDGAVSGFNLRADKDKFIPGLTKLAKVIKQKGSIACLQLNHAGRFARTQRPLLPSPVTGSNFSFNMESLKGFMEFFPFEQRFRLSQYFINLVKTWRHSMTSDDRERVINDFADAALRAQRAGFDMVELHGANGYLLCQFLSPFTNQSESSFGGGFAKRTLFPLAVIRAMKKKLPRGFPIGFRLLLQEWVPGGIEPPEAIAFAELLEKEGIFYLSASAGTYNSMFYPAVLKKMAGAAYLKSETAKLTSRVNIPTIMSGNITTPVFAENLLEGGIADFIGLGRPLRADTEWIRKARDKDQKIIKCLKCNHCLKQVILEKGLNCSRWPKLLRKRTELKHQLLTRNYKALWIISNIGDIKIFKQSLPLLVQKKRNRSFPTILFLKDTFDDPDYNLAQQKFIQWTEGKLHPSGLSGTPRYYNVRESRENWSKIVHNYILKGNYGLIFISSNLHQPWREKLFYKERGKVLVCLNFSNYLHRVIVPVDLSDATLLVLIFLKQNYIGKKIFSFNFVHVTNRLSGQEEQRWEELKKIVNLNGNFPLESIVTKTEVVPTLIKIIQTKRCGTIIMGKRGLSGIKQWLLGSVSSGILRNLSDQSLLVID